MENISTEFINGLEKRYLNSDEILKTNYTLFCEEEFNTSAVMG